jgi:hypothetical protein
MGSGTPPRAAREPRHELRQPRLPSLQNRDAVAHDHRVTHHGVAPHRMLEGHLAERLIMGLQQESGVLQALGQALGPSVTRTAWAN